jgi:hypothetical protein
VEVTADSFPEDQLLDTYATMWDSFCGISVGSGTQTAQLQVSPMDVSVAPGDTITITASGTPAAGGSYSWQLVSSQSGDNPNAFKFVSQPSCAGAASCTATVQATGPGFAGVQVTFPGAEPQTARVRAITVSISQIWSDQFLGGPVANYLPGGAGLVGNARQLMIMGARSDSNGYLKANVVTVPNNQEAWNHVLVRFQPGTPWASQTSPNTSAPVGTCSATACVNGSVLSVSTPAPYPDGDYSVVAGVDRQGAGQASGVLTAQGVGFTFFQPCVVSGEQLDFFTIGPPCSGGAVRIVSLAAYNIYDPAAQTGAWLSSTLYPTGSNFMAAFAVSGTPGNSKIGTSVPAAITISPQYLYFNDGVVFTSPSSAPYNVYTFSASTFLAADVVSNPDFQTLLTDTMKAHNSDVLTYFQNNPNATSHTFPFWTVIGACSQQADQNCTPGTPSYFSTAPADLADQPLLFPCAFNQSLECDLTFSAANSMDLHLAYGRVGYNLMLQATVSPSASNPTSQFVLTSLTVAGWIYDYYQWDPANGTQVPPVPPLSLKFDWQCADVQAGYNTLGPGGQVYQTQVNVTGPVAGVTFTFQ